MITILGYFARMSRWKGNDQEPIQLNSTSCPRHQTWKECKWAATRQNQQNECAPREDSDQPGHPLSLIRVFACAQWVAKDPSFLHADSEDSDQTGRIWVFAELTVILLVLSCRGSNKMHNIHVLSGSIITNCFFSKLIRKIIVPNLHTKSP